MCILSICFSETILDYEVINTHCLNAEIIGKKELNISNEIDFVNFWSKFGNCDIPKIDFSKYNIIGIFLGKKPNPGYGVKITKILEVENNVEVHYKQYLPNPLKGYIQVIVYPYDFIKCEKFSGKVIFKKST